MMAERMGKLFGFFLGVLECGSKYGGTDLELARGTARKQ